jgi:alpha-glucosidase
VADYRALDPLYGTLADVRAFIDRAHALGIRVLLDLVPNHCSTDHALFRQAVAAGPGHPHRRLFHFRDGRGEHGELPPNNWRSNFGGSAWTRITEPDGSPGQWYLHMFAPGQPDWNWEHPAEGLLTFRRGTGGNRLIVAVNFSDTERRLPEHDRVLLASGPLGAETLPPETAVWLAD